jgi:peroxiredoxin family protein
MMVDLFDYREEDFIPEIEEWVSAASFQPRALTADMNLLV